jgi:hypothetical protein
MDPVFEERWWPICWAGGMEGDGVEHEKSMERVSRVFFTMILDLQLERRQHGFQIKQSDASTQVHSTSI